MSKNVWVFDVPEIVGAGALQVYPADTMKKTFYDIPSDCCLFVFTAMAANAAIAAWQFEGNVNHTDDYFYFKHQPECKTVGLVIAKSLELAREDLKLLERVP